MTYIHDHHDWPRFRWENDPLAAPLARVRHKQGRLLGRMEYLGFELRAEASLAVLTSDVMKSSEIEGERLPHDEVRSSIARRLGLDVAGLPQASRHVDGVVEMMLDATQNFREPLTRERLWGWHASLFPTGHSGIFPITVGAWRTSERGPMQVVSGPIGREKVHFQAPPAERLEADMDAFIDWCNAEPSTDPVLRAGIAHLWFVTIHPFEDGNGRIARAIADMMLARADGTKDRFYSMSSAIEAARRAYYDRLEHTQRGGLDITAWLSWFLDCLERAIDQAEDTLSVVLFKARLWERLSADPVNERQRIILNRMLDGFKGHMNTSKYATIAKCSQDTALRDIKDLVERGVLVQNEGGGRSTSYRLEGLDEIQQSGDPHEEGPLE
jgi:Fic family protein